ncbi:hypothetical protein [Ferrimonas lipolytica]|uniref:Uncharacterized protein n=1 Tax=Ferrimonas lipolytica TaxID=2724191 RepID=A0A6H1UK19_9GAMM|nr:hypothetical protein [Ferrimonas lipolytica]QIZ78152.1 hypothetical protein HER31_15335 [Ferrimonas lipolytica]
MKKIALALAVLAPFSIAQAEIIKQTNSVGVGYRAHLGDDADKSNKNDYVVLTAKHKTITDWGLVSLAARYENPFTLEADKPNGKSAVETFKTFADVYYKLGDGSTQLWWDWYSSANQNITEVTNTLGLAYSAKIGKLKLKAGAGLPYSVGHSPLRSYDVMLGAAITRFEFAYPLAANATVFGLADSRWDRDEDFKETFNHSEDNGHHILLGGKYQINKSINIAMVYHDYSDWGGYAKDGQAIETSVNFVF